MNRFGPHLFQRAGRTNNVRVRVFCFGSIQGENKEFASCMLGELKKFILKKHGIILSPTLIASDGTYAIIGVSLL